MNILRNCSECLVFNNGRNPEFNYPLLIGKVFERIGIDTIGPLIETINRNNYIFVATEYLTKYVSLRTSHNKTAEQVANFIFVDIILEHGCPNTILSENGLEYKNKMLAKTCIQLAADKKYASTHRPQTNGLVERTNRTLL